MKAIPQNRTFKVLTGTVLVLVLLLVSSLIHAFVTACPDGWAKLDVLCLFLPTHDDVGTHLLSYVLAGMVVAGAYRGLLLWRTQRKNLAFLARNLKLNETPDGQWRPAILVTGLKDKVNLVDCETPFCFCSGFISPRTHLSRGMAEKLTPEELEAVLLHEQHHMENHDPLKILLGWIAVSALFFVPILKDVFKRYLMEKELAADQSAIRHQGHKHGIAGALYKMLGQKPAALNSSVASSGHLLEARIDYLIDDSSPRRHNISALRLTISLLVIAFLVFTMLAPLPTHSP
ncbi:MAG: M56 family metallopeptidase [Chloroflexota bacterium]|nr:M56 family metallopeptidase [Chloroflexota bacterium]